SRRPRLIGRPPLAFLVLAGGAAVPQTPLAHDVDDILRGIAEVALRGDRRLGDGLHRLEGFAVGAWGEVAQDVGGAAVRAIRCSVRPSQYSAETVGARPSRVRTATSGCPGAGEQS